MEKIIDHASFGYCSMCGDKIEMNDVTARIVAQIERKLQANGFQCDRCAERITPFDKQVKHLAFQWLGPVEYRKRVVSILEPQNASHAVVTLGDGRSFKVFRQGESPRELPEEVDFVFARSFPDLKSMRRPR